MAEDLTIFGEGCLTFREFAMREALPLATIHSAVLEFLQGREDAVLFGAHAVNAYVHEARMTQDVDILALRGQEFTEELRAYLRLSSAGRLPCTENWGRDYWNRLTRLV